MTDQLSKTGRQLNATFLPTSLLRKSQTKFPNTLNTKYQFQKTTGNAFIIIDPPEIKFAGYDLNKSHTATVKVINRAPIHQRITILQPQQACFSLKTNKKGLIASGMSQTLTVVFRSSEHKYQHDVIRINTETDNFVIPLYAYPTLPDLRTIFPKIIDFGTVQTTEPATYYYPIKNSVPLNFQFEFQYQKQCNQISISPLKGVIAAMETVIVQITFSPKAKCTYAAQATLKVHQFDFNPLSITIIGSGNQKVAASLPKRIKSSKLAPIKEGDEAKKNISLKRRPSETKQPVFSNLNVTANIEMPTLSKLTPNATLRKNIRTSYPKLITTKNILGEQQLAKTLNPAKIAEREYLNRFNSVHDLDKEKQIKFASYLGDSPITQKDIQFQLEVARQFQKTRLNTLKDKCLSRYNPENFNEIAVQIKKVTPKSPTWDDKQNDQHHNRRKALLRFMQAGSKVIIQLRLLKRLSKIKEFIAGCTSKQDVRKKIQQSHAKALDQQQGIFFENQINLDFNLESIHPSFFPLQFEENNQEQTKVVFQPEGKTSFIDLDNIKELKVHRIDQFKLTQINLPPDYYNHTRVIPKTRNSGEEEAYFKSSALPAYHPQALTSIYSLPLKTTAHHFIFDNQTIKRYHNYVSADQKDPEISLHQEGAIQDEFEGWTGGDFDILKYKFTRNLGCDYQTFSSYNYSSDRHPLPPLATLGQNLPHTIHSPQIQDKIEQGDSDEQNIIGAPVQSAFKLLQVIEVNPDLKERRAKKVIRYPERQIRENIQRNLSLLKEKATGEIVGRIREANRWIDHQQLRFLI